MSTTTHTRSIHIDAPVETVFEHVQDPKNFYAAMAATSPQDPPKLLDVDVKPEGVGSTYQWTFHLWSLCGSPRIVEGFSMRLPGWGPQRSRS
jgi:hypothetical protein